MQVSSSKNGKNLLFSVLGIGRATVLCNNAELVNPCKIDDIWLLFRLYFASILVRMSFLAPMGTIIGLCVKNVNVIAKYI